MQSEKEEVDNIMNQDLYDDLSDMCGKLSKDCKENFELFLIRLQSNIAKLQTKYNIRLSVFEYMYIFKCMRQHF